MNQLWLTRDTHPRSETFAFLSNWSWLIKGTASLKWSHLGVFPWCQHKWLWFEEAKAASGCISSWQLNCNMWHESSGLERSRREVEAGTARGQRPYWRCSPSISSAAQWATVEPTSLLCGGQSQSSGNAQALEPRRLWVNHRCLHRAVCTVKGLGLVWID